MTFQTLSGTFLVSGMLSFLMGAAMPTWRVFVASDPYKRRKWIVKFRGYWILAHLLFLAGAVLTTIGLAFLIPVLKTIAGRWIGIAGLASALLSTVIWSFIVYLRLSLAAEKYVPITGAAWAYPAYTALTLVSFGLCGLALIGSGFPAWLGMGAIILSGLLLLVYLIRQDLPPLTYYLISSGLGIGLLMVGG